METTRMLNALGHKVAEAYAKGRAEIDWMTVKATFDRRTDELTWEAAQAEFDKLGLDSAIDHRDGAHGISSIVLIQPRR